jgi:phosphate uptake regulator
MTRPGPRRISIYIAPEGLIHVRGAEERRLQVTGGSTYIVSLPKWWINAVGLGKGDAVSLSPQPGGGLLILPARSRGRERRSGVLVARSLEDREEVVRKLLAMYLAGYDAIEVRFEDQGMAELRSYLKSIVRHKMVGVEVVDESQSSIVVRCLLRYSELPLRSVVDRMRVLSLLMVQDAVKAVMEGDAPLAQDVISRDDDVDRLYFLSTRQLRDAISNPVVAGEIGLRSPGDALGYRLITKSLERVADHATSIAQATFTVGRLPERLSDRFAELSSMAVNVVEDSVRALNLMDERVAMRSISLAQEVVKYEERLGREAFDASAVIAAGVRLMLESVRRVAEYGSDIAEATLNMIAEGQAEPR